MKNAEEKYDKKRGLYYDHSTIYKKGPDPYDSVKQFDNIKMNHFENEDDRMAHVRVDPARTVPVVKERVNHPAHYNAGKIEVIDAIVDWDLDFIEGNVVKYVTRAKHKGDKLGDLKKARWYLDYLIKQLEK